MKYLMRGKETQGRSANRGPNWTPFALLSYGTAGSAAPPEYSHGGSSRLAEVHGPGVQVDAAVESVFGRLETHGKLPVWAGA